LTTPQSQGRTLPSRYCVVIPVPAAPSAQPRERFRSLTHVGSRVCIAAFTTARPYCSTTRISADHRPPGYRPETFLPVISPTYVKLLLSLAPDRVIVIAFPLRFIDNSAVILCVPCVQTASKMFALPGRGVQMPLHPFSISSQTPARISAVGKSRPTAGKRSSTSLREIDTCWITGRAFDAAERCYTRFTS
jgi:hypothetical protein